MASWYGFEGVQSLTDWPRHSIRPFPSCHLVDAFSQGWYDPRRNS